MAMGSTKCNFLVKPEEKAWNFDPILLQSSRRTATIQLSKFHLHFLQHEKKTYPTCFIPWDSLGLFVLPCFLRLSYFSEALMKIWFMSYNFRLNSENFTKKYRNLLHNVSPIGFLKRFLKALFFFQEVLNATKRSNVRWMPWWCDNPHFPWKPRWGVDPYGRWIWWCDGCLGGGNSNIFLCSPKKKLGKMNPFWRTYFSKGVGTTN